MTHKLSLISKGNGRWLIHGDLTFAGINKKIIDSPPFLRQGKENIILDLAEVSNTDSAGLALMIEWIKQSGQPFNHSPRRQFKRSRKID